jgi:predicted metal-dependent HD superfamily phosphohydrolase
MRISLLDHVHALLAEKDLRDQQRYDAQTKAVETAMAAQQTAMRTALDAADKFNAMILAAAEKAVTKAEISADKRFELLNELRIGVATKEQFEALEKVVGVLSAEVTEMRASRRGGLDSRATLFTVGGLVIAALGVAVVVISMLVK